jgi:hypothetical protein
LTLGGPARSSLTHQMSIAPIAFVAIGNVGIRMDAEGGDNERGTGDKYSVPETPIAAAHASVFSVIDRMPALISWAAREAELWRLLQAATLQVRQPLARPQELRTSISSFP